MEVSLVAITPKGTQKVFPVGSGVATLGRHSDCTFRIPLGEVSRQHCQIEVKGDKAVLKDLGSSNGTYVNGAKVTTEEPLKAGDIGSLAKVLHFLVRIDGEPKEFDAERLKKGRFAEAKAEATPKEPKKGAAEKPKEAAKPATKPKPKGESSPAKTRELTTVTNEEDGVDFLGESFFLDLEDDDEGAEKS